ncbi:MAG TPA: type I 3-dehydroquinate dehydratase [Blastocatellia bacterium]|nr:type I 3-dehydroquinate dehydratase [Blastocatellia bacterium]
MSRATLIAAISTATNLDGREIAALDASAGWLEVRGNGHTQTDPDWFRDHFDGGLIFSLRDETELSASGRQSVLKAAARRYELVELDVRHDLGTRTLQAVPPEKRIVAWRGLLKRGSLDQMLDRVLSVEARLYKFTPVADNAGDVAALLRLLQLRGRSDLISYAEGAAGFWSRFITPRLSARIVCGLVRPERGTPDEPSIKELNDDYGLPDLPSVGEIYGIVGNPVRHSLSPRLHNAAYRALGLRSLFLPFQVESFEDFWRDVVQSGVFESLGMTLRGLTVVSPYKEAALLTAGESSAVTRRVDAANIFVRSNGHWRADTTDPEGVVLALRGRGISLRRRRTAVIGCGGAGRAVAAALDEAGAHVTLVNRGLERGHRAVELLGLPFVPLGEFDPEGFSMVVNATPVGRDGSDLPICIEGLARDAIVVDLVYGANPTPFISKSVYRGLDAVDGREVLLIQAQRQFEMMTGREMPAGLARDVLGTEAALRCAAV